MSEDTNVWLDVIGPCYSRTFIRKALGMTSQQLDAAVLDLRVLALNTDGGATLYPTWQVFENHVLNGLPEVLTILRAGVDDPWAWARWLVFTPPPEDVNRSPIDELRGGKRRQVIRDAEHIAREWARHGQPEQERGGPLMNDGLVAWHGEGYPPELQRILDRQPPTWAELAVGRGWWPLLAYLDEHLAEVDPDYTVSQVKEKFGGLNYNASTTLTGDAEDSFYRIVRDAEREATVTCDRCGRPGELRVSKTGFYETLCGDHSTGFQRVSTTAGAETSTAGRNASPAGRIEELPPTERASAIAGGVPPEVFAKAGRDAADEFGHASADALRTVQGTWPSARHVGALLRVDEATLLLLSDAGKLSTAEIGGVLRVAPWQLGEGGLLLPGIPDVLKAMPPEYTALDVQTAMTNPNEAFNGRAPHEVLHTPAGVKRVVEWATELTLS